MAMNKQSGEMYDWVSYTWSTIQGRCHHNCAYCYCIGKPFFEGKLRFVEKNLKDNLGKNNTIFVGSSNDLFSSQVPAEWIIKTLEHCKRFDNTYLFQTKNPARFLDFYEHFPQKTIFCITLETNRWYGQVMSNAPHPDERAAFFSELGIGVCTTKEKCVTIEPIMDFDLDAFVTMIKVIRPTKVFIGADSKGHNLPEPSSAKVRTLINELKKFTEVITKSNLTRITGDK